jgi:hypothetical protein
MESEAANMVAEKFLFSRKEAAFSLGISARALDYFIARGELVTKQIGTKKLITRESLRLFARSDHPGAVGGVRKGPGISPADEVLDLDAHA